MKEFHQQVCDDIMLLLNTMKVATVELAEERDLTKMQLFALYAIHQHQPISMGQLAEALYCDASNITGIVDRLVAQDFVIRRESESDRRAKTLKLTPKGAQLFEQLAERLPAKLGCDQLTEPESDALHKIIEKLCAK